ncbi:MAG: AsmA family protein [Endomicrobiaceae bacterium]|nr:AsmA family protein [Endomicrobiaceae bacterium]MDD3922930.1 AsmA family protein [Endomicrobiaceae bacterium]
MKKILFWLIIIFCLFAIAVFIAFKIFLTQEKIKSYIIDYAHTELNREVTFDKLSFNLIGFNLENFAMSEKSTFADGTFIKAKQLIVKINVLPLLHKEITIDTLGIDNMYVEIKRDEEGKFNFNDIIDSKKSQEEQRTSEDDSSNMLLNINDLYVKNSTVKFNDKKIKLNTEISDFNIDLKGFSFTNLFLCKSLFNIKYKQDTIDVYLPININFQTNLNDFDQDKLFLNILSLQTKYNNSDIIISGKVENLNMPKIDCNISMKNIDETTFSDFFTGIKYNIKSLDLKSQATINISSKTAVIDNLSLVLPQSSANISGNIDWSKKDISYDLKSDIDILLDNLSEVIPEYNLKGRFKSKAKITQNLFDGSIDFEDVFSSNQSYGNIANLNAKTHIKAENKKPLLRADFKFFDIDNLNIKITSLNANYNDAVLSLSGQLIKSAVSKINLNLQSKNLSNNTINNFYQSKIEFIMPTLDLVAETAFDFKNKSANIAKLDIKLPESSITTSGNIDWSQKNFIYKLHLDVDLLLDQLAKNITTYNLKGRVKSQATISDSNFSGTLNCTNVAFVYSPFVDISGLNLKVIAQSKNDIVVEQMKGVFNTGNFMANASYTDDNLNIKLRMDKLIIKESSQTNAQKEENKKNESISNDKKSNINITTDIVINEINIPYLISKQAVLNTSLQSVSDKMDKTNGTLNLTIASGKITNVNKLSKNKFAKVFLMIFNVLNNNILNSNNVNNKEKGIIYDNMNCNLLFTNGLMKTQQVSIKMPLTTIATSGIIDFKSGNISMKVNTGLYAAMKVSGTVDNPKTSFDLIGTATDILNSPKGTIEDVGKKLGKSLGNIFK